MSSKQNCSNFTVKITMNSRNSKKKKESHKLLLNPR